MVHLEDQVIAFWVSIGAGCLVAFCFDIYRVLVRRLRLKKIILGIGDVLFWILVAGLVFVILFLSNGGEIRGFMFLGLALGAGIYARLLGVYSVRAINGFFDLLRKLFYLAGRLLRIIWMIITTPIKFGFLVIAWPFRFTYLAGRKILHFIAGLLLRLVPAKIKRAARRLVTRWSLRKSACKNACRSAWRALRKRALWKWKKK